MLTASHGIDVPPLTVFAHKAAAFKQAVGPATYAHARYKLDFGRFLAVLQARRDEVFDLETQPLGTRIKRHGIGSMRGLPCVFQIRVIFQNKGRVTRAHQVQSVWRQLALRDETPTALCKSGLTAFTFVGSGRAAAGARLGRSQGQASAL